MSLKYGSKRWIPAVLSAMAEMLDPVNKFEGDYSEADKDDK